MGNGGPPFLSELDARIAILRDNIRRLVSRPPDTPAPRMKSATRTGSRSRQRSSKP